MPLDLAHGPRPQKPERSGVPGRTETRVARARSIRAVAHAIVRVEQLAAVAHQPVVVKRGYGGNPAFGKQADDTGREAGQVMDVRRVGPELVDHATSDRVDAAVRVRFFERARAAERVVNAHDAQAVAVAGTDLVLRPVGVLIASQHQDVVSQCRQRPGVRVRVHFAAALRGRRKPVHDNKNTHHATLGGRTFQPRAADSAPTYWPSGQAKASASARALRSHRRWVTMHDAMARAR